MKLVALKPIMWNDKGYLYPAGYPSKSGYSHDHGYGHEEWNNNPQMVWRGFRVFHTEGTGLLCAQAQTGDLGIIMIASHAGKPCAVGVGVNVFLNSDEDRRLIAEELHVYDRWHMLWNMPLVRSCHGQDQAGFLKGWKENYQWIRWKCEPRHFHWFEIPIELDPAQLTGKKRVSMHHGTYTSISRDAALRIVQGHLPPESPILEWLAFGDFLPGTENKTTGAQSRTSWRKIQERFRNAPTDRAFRYWVEGERSVEPLHSRLQALFMEYLTGKGIKSTENEDFIDVTYFENGKTVFSEIKPTEKLDTRYAIRIAVGQLLEYRFLRNCHAELEVVLGTKPRQQEIAFLKSIGIRPKWYDAGGGTFREG